MTLRHCLVVTGLMAVLFVSALYALPVRAASVVINSAADTTGACATTGTGACTLRDAITYANANAGADTLTFNASFIITLTSALPALNDDLTIDGAGQNVTVSGNSAVRHFQINAGKKVTLNALTLTAGKCTSCDGGSISNSGTLTVTNVTISSSDSVSSLGGGGVANSGVLTMMGSTFSGDRAISGTGGGAIYNTGTLNLANSTFSGNTTISSTGGGAIYNSGTLNVTNSTFSGNSAISSSAGAIYRNGGTVTLKNTILVKSSFGANCSGTITANAFNLADDATCGSATVKTAAQLALGALASNGGATQTFALGNHSVAIDTGEASVCAASPVSGVDQRGSSRNDLQCDVGAYEYVYADGHSTIKSSLPVLSPISFGPALSKFQVQSGDPGTLTVTRTLTAPGNTPPANALPLTWDATATATPFAMLTTLCYAPGVLTGQTESNLHVYHYNGSSWDELGGVLDTVSYADYHCVTATATLTSLSPLILAPGSSPTLTTMGTLRARVQNGAAVLRWDTLNELNLYGFKVYRRTGNGAWVQLNADVLPAQHSGTPKGDTYTFRDKDVRSGKTYQYRVQGLHNDGTIEWTNEVRVKMP